MVFYSNLHKNLLQNLCLKNNSSIIGEMESLTWRNIEQFYSLHQKISH